MRFGGMRKHDANGDIDNRFANRYGTRGSTFPQG